PLSAATAQGTFQNLDFESINPNVILSQPPNFVPVADALPSWPAYYGTDLATQTIVNGISLGGVLVTVITPFATSPSPYLTNYVIGGVATVTLDAGVNSILTAQVSAAIAQTGVIP